MAIIFAFVYMLSSAVIICMRYLFTDLLSCSGVVSARCIWKPMFCNKVLLLMYTRLVANIAVCSLCRPTLRLHCLYSMTIVTTRDHDGVPVPVGWFYLFELRNMNLYEICISYNLTSHAHSRADRSASVNPLLLLCKLISWITMH